MKTIYTLLFGLAFGISNAQSFIDFGNSIEYFNNLNKKRQTNILSWDKQKINLNIYKKDNRQILGTTGEKNGLVVFNKSKTVEGFIITSIHKNTAIKFTTNSNGNLIGTPAKADEFICIELATPGDKELIPPVLSESETPPAWDPYDLQSNPGATAVIYCDFDGYNLPSNTPWNNGAALNAAASGYSDMDVLMAWNVLVEDYAPFDVNVTTNESVYNSAPNGLKTRVVFTPTSYWSRGGGVALLNSFNWTATTVCWVFSDGFQSSVTAAEAGSHEAGHTLGLKHDGQGSQEYYKGHTPWAPIMGASYYEALTQWSIGDYSGATNQQQDLNIIESSIGGYRIDDHGNTINTSSEINYDLVNGIAELTTDNKGIISTRNDVDLFHFYLAGGQINLSVKPTGLPKPNLDLEVKLLDSNGNVLATELHGHTNFTNLVTINKVLAGGDYYIQIDGIGTGNATTGWTDYGSLGQYQLEGTIEGIEQKDFDAAIMNINKVGAKTCGNSLTPEIEILNGGKININSIKIAIYINNQLIENKTHQIQINSGSSSLVNLDVPISNFGDHTLKIELSEPNGQVDQINSNNVSTVDFNINPGQLFSFKISETSLEPNMNWTIKDGNSTIESNSSVASKTIDGFKTQNFCLENLECYEFKIDDAFLKDLCNQYPAWDAATIYQIGDQLVYQGRIYEATAQIWAANPIDYAHYYNDLGNCPEPNQNDLFEFKNVSLDLQIATQLVSEYANSYSTNFCVDIILNSTNDEIPNLIAFPNPFSDRLFFSQNVEVVFVFNSIGKLETHSKINGNSISMGDLASGLYFIKVKQGNTFKTFKIIKK